MELLIVGCHRSGTTLLASMIGAHKDIAIVNEDFYNSYSKIVSKKIVGTKMVIPTLDYDKKKGFILTSILGNKYIQKILFYLFWWIRYISITNKYFYKVCTYSIKDFIDKKAKIIFISRDVEENVKSILKYKKQTERTAKGDVLRTRYIKHKLQDSGYKDVLYITLQELTHTPELTIKRICEFLDIEYDNKMLEGYKYNPTYSWDGLLKQN